MLHQNMTSTNNFPEDHEIFNICDGTRLIYIQKYKTGYRGRPLLQVRNNSVLEDNMF